MAGIAESNLTALGWIGLVVSVGMLMVIVVILWRRVEALEVRLSLREYHESKRREWIAIAEAERRDGETDEEWKSRMVDRALDDFLRSSIWGEAGRRR